MCSTSSFDIPSSSIIIPQEWSDATETILNNSVSSKPPIAFVCGPNNCGKTTFSRHLVNVLLRRHKKVVYLDTDSGQTVFTPPGLLSLTVIDEITPGIGYEILVDMIKYMSPIQVVKIHTSFEMKNLPAGAFWMSEGILDTKHVIEINAALKLVRKDASHIRDMRVMEYFKQCFPIEMDLSTRKGRKKLGRALAAHPPYEVSVSSVKIKHLHCQVPKTEIFYSLNATIVGLAISSEVSEQLPQCVGLGIVRGINTSKGVLYIITPVPLQILKDVDLLLQGFVQIPTCLLEVPGYISPYMSRNVIS